MTKSENDYRQERMEDYPLEHKFDIGTMDLESKTLVPKNRTLVHFLNDPKKPIFFGQLVDLLEVIVRK